MFSNFFRSFLSPFLALLQLFKFMLLFLFILKMISKICLKLVTSEKIGWSEVTSTLGTGYGGVVMGVLLSFAVWNSTCVLRIGSAD